MVRPLVIFGSITILRLLLVCDQIGWAQNDPQRASIATRESVVERDGNGLYTLATPRLTLISDLPFDDELRSWPALLDQSIEQWQQYFGVQPQRMENWKIKALLIKDRNRFAQLGLLDEVPAFDEGYQFGDVIYVREQPTVYYRRLLFLHEATHWMIWKLYGGGGSPWFMEGMAELQGTHSLVDGVLKLGVVPSSRDQVAGWGRLRLIHETLKQGHAPTMSEILAYGNAREDHEIRYSWSWAACVFFTRHPKYGPILSELYSKKLDYSNALSSQFKRRLKPYWSEMQLEWNAFLSDLDFGFDYERSTLPSSANLTWNPVRQEIPALFPIASDRGWQPTGILVEADKPLRIECDGSFQLASRSLPNSNWIVAPCGVTYRYYRGNPLGCVIASVVPDDSSEATKPWETLRVGLGTVVKSPKPGKLFLKVNEPSSGLYDNSGSISVKISVTNP